MTRLSFIIICLSLFIFSSIHAVEGFSCSASRDDAIVVEWELPGYELESVDDQYSRILADTPAWTGEVGAPELPLFSTMAALPEAGAVSLVWEILEDEWLDITPTAFNEPDSLQWRDPDVYEADYPASPITLTDPGVMRNRRVGGICVSPFVWRGEEGRLQVIRRARLTLHVDNTRRGVNEITRQMPASRAFEDMFENTLVNYEQTQTRDEHQQPCILFISRSSTVQSNMALLVMWKRMMGYEVHNVTTSETGATNTSIKNYIQTAYDTWPNPPEFVVLVGDADDTSFDIPTWMHSWEHYNGEGDHPYTLLEGNDQLEDVCIGRLSFSTTLELQTIVNKILRYEREPYTDTPGWFHDNLLVGDTDPSGVSCISTNKYIKELMLTYDRHHEFTELYGTSPSPTQMNNALNAGALFFNYRGWIGMSSWTNSNINALTNTNMTPVSVIITCDTGTFTDDVARSEALLRRGSPSDPRGGVCAVGMSTSGTHTAYNNCLDGGIFEGIFLHDMRTIGEAVLNGRTYMWETYNNSQPHRVETFSHICNLMGDPSLQVWKTLPKAMNASFPAVIDTSADQITVHVTDGSGQPVADAWVTACTSSDAIFATDWTGDDGYVSLPITPGNTGTVDLTVTCPGYKPELESFSISSNSYDVRISDMTFDDDASGSSSGNGDGVVNPGESIEWKVQLQNIGNYALNSVNAQLTALDPEWINISDNSETWGRISAGQSGWCDDDFDFTIDAACPGGTEIRMLLNIAGGLYATEQLVVLTVEGPALQMQLVQVNDGGNGVLDPAETASVNVRIINNGSLASATMTAVLSCEDEEISISTATVGYHPISAGGSRTGDTPFVISASQFAIPGTVVTMRLDFTGAGGEEAVVTFPFTIGVSQQGDPVGPDSYGYVIYDSGDTDYDLAPVYDWVEIDPNYGGHGTNCNLNDTSEDMDDVMSFTLPFQAWFYGLPYNQVSVCSNGWFSFGVTEQVTFRNWRMPGPIGPAAQVAVFWDDLLMGSGDVYRWYDSANHRYVIQWSRMENAAGDADETFQAIIYDPAHHPSQTGDSAILLQYLEVNNIDDNGYDDHGCYATVGIEDHTGLRGIEYTFDDMYPAAAQTLSDGLALLITGRPEVSDPPVAVIDNSPRQYSLQPNGATNDAFTIGNSGEATLHYSINTVFDVTRPGGPDEFGYSWISSVDPGGPSYQWYDIQNIGTPVSLSDDDMSNSVSIGFSFPFYGVNYTSLRICSNGFVSFTDTATDWSNNPIPDDAAPNNIIAAFWDDLSPQNGGQVDYYRDTANDCFIVQFTDVDHYEGTWSGEYTFQMQLYENGRIYFYYQELEGDIDTNTIGIENQDGTGGLQVVFDQTYAQDGMAILIYSNPVWLTVNTLEGNVETGESDEISFDIDTADLDLGDYSCTIYVSTNDINAAEVEIPVSLHVASQVYPPLAPEDLMIAMSEGDAWLEWAAVTQDTHGNPLIVNHYNVYRCPVGQELAATPENLYATTSQTNFHDASPLAGGARYLVTADTAAASGDAVRR